MVSASTSANEPAKHLILVHTVQLKPMIKAYFSGRMVCGGAFASVHSEKTWLKKSMMRIMRKKSQEGAVLSRRQKLTSDVKLRPEK